MALQAKNLTRLVALGLFAIAVVSAGLYWMLKPQPQPAQVIYGSGRVEADEVRISVEVPGRLLENAAVEGQNLSAGQLVARLDPNDYVLQADRAAAQRAAAQRAAAQLVPQINLARHHAETARIDLQRFESLSAEGAVSAREVDFQRNANRAAIDEVRILQEQQARAGAEAEVASKSLALAQSQIGKTRIFAPISGAVLERLVEPGEVLAPGQAVAVVANLSRVKLKLFVSERDLGKVRLGAVARLRVDAFPERYFDARVARIDAQAQFTPRDIHMADERSRTVYGITLEAANPDGFLKPGMPADAWILWNARAGWPARLTVPE
ncbi:HlyD family secretion protein [Rhizorhapis sp. SPR117]|uniref:HlyD family secretion protein n=1 Tax=Rhizorhapis sp. SPR117 TaxID=2912611 RepID=UPI001F02D699|nr:efflux RND transporter periplasmic adaptor subunit [Rhizorhapis sp. SPR117]